MPLPRNCILHAAMRARCFSLSRPWSRQRYRGSFHRGKDRQARRRSRSFSKSGCPTPPDACLGTERNETTNVGDPSSRSALTRSESATYLVRMRTKLRHVVPERSGLTLCTSSVSITLFAYRSASTQSRGRSLFQPRLEVYLAVMAVAAVDSDDPGTVEDSCSKKSSFEFRPRKR